MKKIGLLLPALMWLAFFPSCNQEIEPVTPEEEPVPEGCYFRAYPETPEGDSRTYLDGLNVIWRVGEELQVMNCAGSGTEGTICNFESLDNARKALFYYEGTDFEMTPPYFAIYPATATVRRKSPGPIFEYTVPAAQTASVNSFSDGTNVAIGFAGADKKLKMYNLNAYVCFKIDKADLVDKAILSCETGTLAGKMKKVMVSQDFSEDACWTGGNFTYISRADTTHSITLTPPAGNTRFPAGTYYIAINPDTYNASTSVYTGYTNLRLDLKNGDKLVSRKMRLGDFSATRNTVYDLGNITPSDVASAFGKAKTVKNVFNITKRTLAEGLDYYYVQTTSRTSNEGDSETWDDVNFHILEIQFSDPSDLYMHCVLPYNAPTPWVDNPNTDSGPYDPDNAWDTQSIYADHWVDEVNNGDEHVLAMFPCSDYNSTTKVPYGPVHSRGQILRSTSIAPPDKDAVTVRRYGATPFTIRGLSFQTDAAYPYSTYYNAPANYSDLGGSFNRLIKSGELQSYEGWESDNSPGPHAAIGYVGDNTMSTGSYKKAYYVLSSGGYPYNLADLMMGLGCYNAAMQHPGEMGELILENSGKNGYEVQGNASEPTTKVMTAWALVLKKQFERAWLAGNSSSPGLEDGTGTAAQLKIPQGICWSKDPNVAYFTQRGSQALAVRKIDVSNGDVTTLVSDTAESPSSELNGPYGCCAYKLGETEGVLVANRSGGRPYKLIFVPNEESPTIEPINDTDLVAGITDVKWSGEYVWLASTKGYIYKGHIEPSSGVGYNYAYVKDKAFDVSEYGKYPCCLAFDSSGNTLYGTWFYSEDVFPDSKPGIYLIPSIATDNSDIERIAGGSVQLGSDLGTPGDMTTASFPVVSGLYCGSDDGLYIACGFTADNRTSTNSLRKLIPVKKWDAVNEEWVLTAESYKKGRMISIKGNTSTYPTGVIVNNGCTEVYATDFQHRILKVTISH